MNDKWSSKLAVSTYASDADKHVDNSIIGAAAAGITASTDVAAINAIFLSLMVVV